MNQRHNVQKCAALLLLLSAFCLSGCGDGGPPRGSVSGQVTLDGAPLAQGSILFVPIEGNQGIAAGGQIVDGKYSLAGDAGVSLGANRVEIRGLRKSGRKEQKPFAPQGEMVESTKKPSPIRSIPLPHCGPRCKPAARRWTLR